MNKRIHDEVKEFDASKQYLQNEKVDSALLYMHGSNNVSSGRRSSLRAQSRVPPTNERHANTGIFGSIKIGSVCGLTAR